MVRQSRRIPCDAETDAARDRDFRINRSGRLLTKKQDLCDTGYCTSGGTTAGTA